MNEKLNRLLAHIDMAQGTPFSRFNDPDYQPTEKDVDEAIGRFDNLIDTYARLAMAYGKVDKNLAEFISLVRDLLAAQSSYMQTFDPQAKKQLIACGLEVKRAMRELQVKDQKKQESLLG